MDSRSTFASGRREAIKNPWRLYNILYIEQQGRVEVDKGDIRQLARMMASLACVDAATLATYLGQHDAHTTRTSPVLGSDACSLKNDSHVEWRLAPLLLLSTDHDEAHSDR